MFNLIGAVIAVALFILLTIASIYYMAPMNSASDKAIYTQMVNGIEQINGALKYYQIDHGSIPSGTSQEIFSTLTTPDTYGRTYLSTIPLGSWKIVDGTVYRLLDGEQQCRRMNTAAKMDVDGAAGAYNGCPPCSNNTFKDWPACSNDDGATATVP